MAKWLKIIAVSLSALLSGITSFATAEESYEQRIEKLEDLLEIYFEENRQLKQKVSDLENKLESFDKAASAKPKSIREKCEADINGCSDENVCAIATRTKDSVKKWKLGNKFFYEAKRRGLTCGVKLGSNKLTAKQRCEANIRGCSETALCEVATYTTYNNKKEWARGNSFVKFATEAKRRGLTCGVKEESNYLTAFRNAKKKCEKNIQTCSTTDICLLATYKVKDGYRWLSGASSTYVSEAKRRGLTCGVKSADTCKSNIKNCTNGEICKQLKLSNESESKKYFLEAESRGLSCGAKPLGNPEKSLVTNCPTDVTQCDEKSLCDTATWISAGNKKWKLGAYTQYVDEAKRRGLTCGVNTDKGNSNKSSAITNNSYNGIKCTVEGDQPSKGLEYMNQRVNKFVKRAKEFNYLDRNQPFNWCWIYGDDAIINFNARRNGTRVRLEFYEKKGWGMIIYFEGIMSKVVGRYIYSPSNDYAPFSKY